MPPRHAYWTIILEGKPTAFRSHTSDELLPTLRQLQARHPDAVMKWFARGRLWTSPDEERQAATRRRTEPRERRPSDWRPGGAHVDPRDRFKVPRDEKRRRFVRRMRSDPPGPRPPDTEGGPRSSRPPSRPRPPGGGEKSGKDAWKRGPKKGGKPGGGGDRNR